MIPQRERRRHSHPWESIQVDQDVVFLALPAGEVELAVIRVDPHAGRGRQGLATGNDRSPLVETEIVEIIVVFGDAPPIERAGPNIEPGLGFPVGPDFTRIFIGALCNSSYQS